MPLPSDSRCPRCRGTITLAREVNLARGTWEQLRPLEPDADTIHVERHLPTQFNLGPPRLEAGGLFNLGYGGVFTPGGQRPRRVETYPSSIDPAGPSYPPLASALSSSPRRIVPPRVDLSASFHGKGVSDPTVESGFSQMDTVLSTDPPLSAHASSPPRRPSQLGAEHSPVLSPADTIIPQTPRTAPLLAPPEKGPPEKGKSKWKLKFTGSRKASIGTSADSSSLSSTVLEAQRLDEITLSGLVSIPKSASRSKAAKNVNVYLSQSSTLALFWTPSMIQVWDVGTSPPTLARAIATESACILAAVARVHLTYIVGTRDQKLTASTTQTPSLPPVCLTHDPYSPPCTPSFPARYAHL